MHEFNFNRNFQGGWDFAFYAGNFGWVDIKELPGARIYFVGFGWAGIGFTKVDPGNNLYHLAYSRRGQCAGT